MTIGIIEFICSACATGGVVYLIVERFLNRRRTKEEVKHQQVDNIKEAVNYGVPMITIYKQIDEIVEKKTAPIQEKLDTAIKRIGLLESTYCCYREHCKDRIRTKSGEDFFCITDVCKKQK